MATVKSVNTGGRLTGDASAHLRCPHWTDRRVLWYSRVDQEVLRTTEVDPSLHRSSNKRSVCVAPLSRSNNQRSAASRGRPRPPGIRGHECLAPRPACCVAQWIIVAAKTLIFFCQHRSVSCHSQGSRTSVSLPRAHVTGGQEGPPSCGREAPTSPHVLVQEVPTTS